MPVQTQWDVGTSAFSTVTELRELIGIASQPDVQPQAILAAERLGYGLVVSPRRINDAVEALDKSDSVRLESIQAHIGLRHKDLQRIVRKSTPLLQFFVTITACKTCFTDSELGDIAFSMMAKTSILARHPVSSPQLAQVIHTFSSNSEMILPISELHEIAVAVDSQHPTCGDLYQRLDSEEFAELLVRTFEAIVDDTVAELILKGHTNAVSLATLFSWLCPETTHVIVGGNTIRGQLGAKMTLEIIPDGHQPWELEIFKSDGDVTKYLLTTFSEEMGSIHRLPLCQAKSYFDDHYTSAIEDPVKRRIAIQTMGELARVMTIFFCEHGKVFVSKECCGSQSAKCQTASISKIMSETALASYSNVVLKYGWTTEIPEGLGAESDKLKARLDEAVSQFRQQPPQGITKLLNEVCSAWVAGIIDSACDATYIIDPAIYIAFDAVVTSTTLKTTATRYFSPMTALDLERTDGMVDKLLSSGGLEIRVFRELAFKHLLPGLPTFHPQDLVVNYGGFTVGMGVLWKISTKQSAALGIQYALGHIEKDGTPLSRVREADFNSMTLSTDSAPVSLFERGVYTPLVSYSSTAVFQTRTSIQGDQLVLKHYIEVKNQSQTSNVLYTKGKVGAHMQKASWTTAMDIIATATHVGRGHDLTVSQEREIAQRLHEKGLTMAWHNTIPLFNMESGSKILLRTSGAEKLRFFSASSGYDKYIISNNCFGVVVRHNAPLLSSVSIAEETQDTWVIIV